MDVWTDLIQMGIMILDSTLILNLHIPANGNVDVGTDHLPFDFNFVLALTCK